jgi:hypothetical protein
MKHLLEAPVPVQATERGYNVERSEGKKSEGL